MLIDTHCHLDKLDLANYDGNVALALDSAAKAGVGQLVTISVDLDDMDTILAFTERAGVYATAGVHPLHSDALLTKESQLLPYLDHPKIIAIGETGLDYFYEADTGLHKAQQTSFALHLEASKGTKMPVIVHTRDARKDTIDIIKAHGDVDVGGVLHCFTESYEMAKAALDENYLISISGIITFNNANELRDVIKKLPLDRLLIETDSPYLAPVPHRGKKNEPQYVASVAQFVADLKGVRYESLLEQTAENFFRHFPKASIHNRLQMTAIF
jgi:TatD DNase family protein